MSEKPRQQPFDRILVVALIFLAGVSGAFAVVDFAQPDRASAIPWVKVMSCVGAFLMAISVRSFRQWVAGEGEFRDCICEAFEERSIGIVDAQSRDERAGRIAWRFCPWCGRRARGINAPHIEGIDLTPSGPTDQTPS